MALLADRHILAPLFIKLFLGQASHLAGLDHIQTPGGLAGRIKYAHTFQDSCAVAHPLGIGLRQTHRQEAPCRHNAVVTVRHMAGLALGGPVLGAGLMARLVR